MAKWKPVPIDSEGVFENIEGLIGIEVLEDDNVHVIKGKVNNMITYLLYKTFLDTNYIRKLFLSRNSRPYPTYLLQAERLTKGDT